MTRINALRNIVKSSSFQSISGPLNALVFAAVLIVCSIGVGCSSDKPKPVSSNTQISMTQPAPAFSPMPAPVAPLAPKAVPKKSAPKKPASVNYTDKANGVTFEYPRRYAIDTGDAASSLVLSHPVPMNFVAPGGTALAAVELPETGFANTDFSSAFFSVSVHKDLTADQCTEFAVPQPKQPENTNLSEAKGDGVKTSEAKPSDVKTSEANVAQTSPEREPKALSPASAEGAAAASPATEVKTETQSTPVPAPSESCHPEDRGCGPKDLTSADTTSAATTLPTADSVPAPTAVSTPTSVDLKELTLNATEAVSGEGTRQSDSRYFHVYQNGSCYEFALNVTTNANGDGLTKHIDRDKVFARLEKILDTVKLEDVKAAPVVAAEPPAAQQPAGTPAQ